MANANRLGYLVALALVLMFPNVSSGQAAPSPGLEANIKVDLEFDHAKVTDALRQLFQQAKVSYFIDPDVTSKPFSAGFHGVPFRTVLDVLLKIPDFGLTCSIRNGIYYIKQVEEYIDPAPHWSRTGLIHTVGGNVDKIISFLKSRNFFESGDKLSFTSFPGSSILFVGYPDNAEGEAEFRQFRLWFDTFSSLHGQ